MLSSRCAALGHTDKDKGKVRVGYFQNSPLVRLALIGRSEPSEISCHDWSADGDEGRGGLGEGGEGQAWRN